MFAEAKARAVQCTYGIEVVNNDLPEIEVHQPQ